MKLLAIINPISGTGKQKHIASLLNSVLDREKFDLTIKYTEYAKHGTELARQAISDGFDAVLAVGGDGTINEIAQALTHSKVALGIIPSGSGNGLARHMGIPMNSKKAIQWLNRAEVRPMDTLLINDHFSLNVAGIGFDAHISHVFAKMNSRGLVSYAKATWNSFFNYPEYQFTILQNGEQKSYSGFVLSICNSSQFGNNAHIAPNADISDGQVNLVVLKKPRWYQLPQLMLRSFTNTIDRSSLFTEIKGEAFQVSYPSNEAHVDGEPIVIEGKLNIKIQPASLYHFSGQ
ncbi:YegS/Rv2252/BmrU family lipid kinase [Prolixibacteraceae bacterium JC049]|nr:YegS/Rv2252/BmrU family lipid kinase [Prolixibacteraceae bacterium JC049]